tara:strand:- start:409 stop:924 length:516 start_codon:yes stop_codon:yes gene_type:complete
MRYYLLFLIFLISACAKEKSVFICGDHQCINKAEAKQYFEENLTIEIQIVTKEKKTSYDLVNLNIGNEKSNIKVYKNKNKKIVKKLSKKEAKLKKKELKIKKKKTQPVTSNEKININLKQKSSNEIMSTSKIKNNSVDICLKLEKCDIDSISDYLIKVSNKKDFPNISLKE